MEENTRQLRMSAIFHQLIGEVLAMSQKMGANDTMQVLAGVVAYAIIINRSINDADTLDVFRKNIEEQIKDQRPQLEPLLRMMEEEQRKAGK